MFKNLHIHFKLPFLPKCILISYLFTTGLLLLIALLLYRFNLSESIVAVCIIAVYILATFLSGMLMGKHEKSRKFLWGLLSGVLYFAVLFFLSIIIHRGFSSMSANMFTVLLLCAGGGMLGGMLS